MWHLQCGALMKSSLSEHYIRTFELILRLEQIVAIGKIFGTYAATCWLANHKASILAPRSDQIRSGVHNHGIMADGGGDNGGFGCYPGTSLRNVLR